MATCSRLTAKRRSGSSRLDEQELLLSFDDFPWFRQATVDAILNVERPAPNHLRWPDLDIDLAADSIEHPGRYPLKSKL